jgi:hypothetical protein
MVPFSQMLRLKDAARANTLEWVEFPDSQHMDAYMTNQELYWPALRDFLAAHVVTRRGTGAGSARGSGGGGAAEEGEGDAAAAASAAARAAAGEAAAARAAAAAAGTADGGGAGAAEGDS